MQDLEKIADCKQSGSFQAWKYNEQKTLNWLEKKVSRISQHLKDSSFNVTHSTVSANYVKAAAAIVPESNICKVNIFSLNLHDLRFRCFRFVYAIRIWVGNRILI